MLEIENDFKKIQIFFKHDPPNYIIWHTLGFFIDTIIPQIFYDIGILEYLPVFLSTHSLKIHFRT
jgi:hypothetical protein